MRGIIMLPIRPSPKRHRSRFGQYQPANGVFEGVMIWNQIVTAKESAEAYNNLEKAIDDFEQHKDKNAFGEDKLMEMYRIKIELQKVKAAIQREAERKIAIKKEYEAMIYRLASEFPKTEITVADFISNIPEAWSPLRVTKSTEKLQQLTEIKIYLIP